MRLQVALLAVLTLVPAAPRDACAASRCTCAFDIPGADADQAVESQLRVSSAVFLGTVQRIDTSTAGPVVAHFAVTRRWKGAPVDSIAVVVREAPRAASTCEIDVRLGESYLVFARPRGERALQTYRCDGTTLDAYAGRAVTVLTRLGAAARETQPHFLDAAAADLAVRPIETPSP